jgi:hypothetical protein
MKYVCTFQGLHDWSDAMFEKLGWMTLAVRDGNRHHVRSYISGLLYLVKKIKEKHAETVDTDRKNDLMELYNNVLYLHDMAKKLLK